MTLIMISIVKKYSLIILSVGLVFFSACSKKEPVIQTQSAATVTNFVVPLTDSVSLNKDALLTSDTTFAKSDTCLKPKKIKVLIFSSTGGAGHIIASQAMTDDLKDFCEVTTVNAISDILGPLDHVGWVTRGRWNGEKLYNSLLTKGWIRTTNFMSRYLAPGMVMSRVHKIEQLMAAYLEKEKPDVLISVIPFINYPASNVATRLGIPYLLVTTDNDLTNWLRGVQKIKHSNFRMTVGYDLEQTRGKALAKNIPPKNIHITGFPLKKAFQEPKDVQAIRTQWQIPQDKFVIMVSMGGNGSMTTYKYIKHLAKHSHNAHILACVGRNAELAKKLKDLKLKEPLSMSIIEFTPYIADLMAVSDVLITKPGPGMINEAMYSNLPMILDYTSACLYWEKAGIEFVLKGGFGNKNEYFRDINKTIKKYIEDKPFYNAIKKRIQDFKKTNFGDFLRAKIKELYEQRHLVAQDPFCTKQNLK